MRHATIVLATFLALAGCQPSGSSAAVKPSPSPPSYAVRLSFAGAFTATVTQVQPGPANTCLSGAIAVSLLIQGAPWTMTASLAGYSGPALYRFPAFIIQLNGPNYDIWRSTSGSATYVSATSLTLTAVLTDLLADPGEPQATARVEGTLACS